MEVEQKQEGSTLVSDHLVFLMLELNVLGVGQPFGPCFEMIDGDVEIAEVLISQEGILSKVPATACVVITVVVSSSREINPLRVSKLSCESD